MSSAPETTGSDAERQLRLAYQHLAAHVDNTPLAVIEWDREFRVVRWNGQAERVFGWSASELVGKRLGEWRFVHDADADAVRAGAAELLAGRNPRSTRTNRNYTKSGAVVWIEWHNSIEYDDAGGVASVLSLALDVTERRATTEALAVSEARVRASLDSAKMLAWDLELETNRWHTTADIPDFYGLPRGPDYTDARNALAAIHPDDVPAVLAGRARALESGEPMAYEFRGAVPAADGGPRWFSTRGQVVRDATGAPRRIVAVTTEVTDQKRADADRAALNRQLEDARRWESLGVLAGGIAHDFNNILTVVMGSAALARRGLPVSGPAAGYLDQIEQASRRAADVCRQMLAYAGRAVAIGTRADLAAATREAALAAPRGPAVRLEFDPHLPAVRGDPAQVRQLALNLITNAVECGAPEVVVSGDLEEVPDAASDAGFRLAPPPGRYVVLTVTDTGPGMPAEVRDRMFDPFFSTKFTGRGLGLAAVLGIARAHKGGIRVVTVLGRGTSVAVYWPVLADGPPRSALHAPRPAV
jgi:two-component system, cell cycle sensor histidine kinase and response regulator CckA